MSVCVPRPLPFLSHPFPGAICWGGIFVVRVFLCFELETDYCFLSSSNRSTLDRSFKPGTRDVLRVTASGEGED